LIVIVGHDTDVVNTQINNLFHYLVKNYWSRKLSTDEYLSAEERREISDWIDSGRMIVTSHYFIDAAIIQLKNGYGWEEITERIRPEPVPDLVVYIKPRAKDSNSPIYEEMAEKNIIAPWVTVNGDQELMNISYDIIKIVTEKLDLDKKAP
jgi:hypothetical protein